MKWRIALILAPIALLFLVLYVFDEWLQTQGWAQWDATLQGWHVLSSGWSLFWYTWPILLMGIVCGGFLVFYPAGWLGYQATRADLKEASTALQCRENGLKVQDQELLKRSQQQEARFRQEEQTLAKQSADLESIRKQLLERRQKLVGEIEAFKAEREKMEHQKQAAYQERDNARQRANRLKKQKEKMQEKT